VVATTPYVVRGGAEAHWVAYLERERQRAGSKIPVHKMDATRLHQEAWPQCQSLAGHCKEAVFLTGIPDIKENLPHA